MENLLNKRLDFIKVRYKIHTLPHIIYPYRSTYISTGDIKIYNGVKTVTGNIVNNSDPLNPIINVSPVGVSNDYNDLDNLPPIPEFTDNKVQTIGIIDTNLSGIGTLEEQIVEYITNNIEIDYSLDYSKLNIVLLEGEEENEGFPYTFPVTLT